MPIFPPEGARVCLLSGRALAHRAFLIADLLESACSSHVNLETQRPHWPSVHVVYLEGAHVYVQLIWVCPCQVAVEDAGDNTNSDLYSLQAAG